MPNEADSGIRIEDGKVVFGMVPCILCAGIGLVRSRKDCSTCLGTGLGPRGGRNGCKTCSGMRTVPDAENPVGCSGCKGCGTTRAHDCSWLPQEVWRSMDFFVYAPLRNISLAQLRMNRQFCYTIHSWALQAARDTELIEAVSQNLGVKQVRWICKVDGTLADHIGIFVCPDGYAVLPVFGDDDFIGKGFYIPN
jgi:hypothetical protein